MRIGELSDTTGLSVDTIRFYEKRGLLTEKHFCRKDNNYRDYAETAVARLVLIRQGQMVGLTLAEIAHFIEAWEMDTLTARQKIEFFEHKIEQVDAKIAELERTKTDIRAKIAMLDGAGSAGLAGEKRVIDVPTL
jgi:MerR family copper efflux transcriptional regulator